MPSQPSSVYCKQGKVKREYVQVLRLLERFDMEDLHGAIKDALRMGAISFDAVKHLALCRVERILNGEQVDASELLSSDIEERAILARRLIAERCLYGVDMNPLAVERPVSDRGHLQPQNRGLGGP